MLVNKPILYLLLLISLMSIFACNDPAAIDTDIVDIDLIDIQSMDDFDLTSYSTLEDSISSFSQGLFGLPQYPFGIDEDPVFGTVVNAITAQYLLTDQSRDFTDAVVDSVIMELNFSQAIPYYGDSVQMIGFEVLEIAETLDFNTEYFTNHITELEGNVIGSYQGIPNFRDSVSVGRWVSDSLIFDTFPPQIRFNLDNSFGERVIFSPEETLETNTAFLETFKGLHIRPTIANNGMIGLDLSSFSSLNQTGLPGATVQIFYNIDGIRDQFELAVSFNGSVKLVDQLADRSGSIVEEFLDDEVLGDSLVFVQGMTGPNVVVKFEDLDRLDGAIINGATLEVFATALNGDEDIRTVPGQLVLLEENVVGNVNLSRDFLLALNRGAIENAGGVPEDIGGGIYKYSFDVGGQLQDIIEGIEPNELTIRSDLKVGDLRRAVIFGAGHSTYPIKLNVTYTKL